MRRLLVVVALIVAGCGTDAVPDDSDATPSDPAATQGPARDTPAIETSTPLPDPMEMPLSLYVVREAEGGDGAPRSSARDEAEVGSIASRIAEIWSPAGVIFDPVGVYTIDVPSDVLADLIAGDANSFLEGAGRVFDVPDAGAINGFYVSTAGGANGFTPQGSRVFFVTDEPSVHHERVSSHEIGHILGLRHALDDSERLMFSGTNGMTLTDTEITVARYGAAGILDGTR